MSEDADGLPPFQEVVRQVVDTVVGAISDDWSRLSDLNDVPDAVYLKNAEGVMVHVNEAYLRNFSRNESPLGRSGQQFLDKSIIDVSRQTDVLVLSGSNALDCEHTGRGGDGRLYLLRTYKRNLTSLGNPGLAILGVTRQERQIEDGEPHPRAELIELHRRFRALDETDREICRQIGQGMKVREIAEALGLTSRAVEQRKKKVLELLELEQTLDLVKLLVRLQDRGFVDLGL